MRTDGAAGAAGREGVAALAYLGFEAANLDAWAVFAADVLGLMVARDANGRLRLRADARDWRIEVAAGGRDDLAFLGFDVAGEAGLDRLADRLAAAGLQTQRDPALAAERGVLGLLRTQDPDGLPVEIVYGARERREQPFQSPAGVTRFMTGDQGLGHVVLATSDIAAARHFWRELLGFRLSDIIHMRVRRDAGFDMEFYHCNRRHHTLALAPVPSSKRLHHFMLQAGDLDDVGFALDRAVAAGASITQGLGRHTNDEMVSFYLETPSGFQVEFGVGGREIADADWRVTRHDRASVWGHRRPVRA